MDATITQLPVLIEKGGVVLGLLLILVGGYRGWWVFGRHYDDLRAERDQWRQLAMNGHAINRDAVSTLTTMVK